MKKYYYFSIIAFLFATNIIFGQVGIGTQTPHSSTALDIVSNDKGVLIPQIALTDENTWAPLSNPSTEGMLVYNTSDNTTLDPGYYFWDGSKWQSTGVGERTNIVTDGVIPSILGYNPIGVANTAPAQVTVDGITFTKQGCKQWSVNGHYYCAYTSGNNGDQYAGGVNWGTAYNVGKSLEGYLVTITSNDEWNWLLTNIINSGTGYNLQNNIWIGNNKAINMSFAPANQPAPGIPIEFLWITGEESKHNWSNTTTIEQNFADNSNIQDEPNNYGNNEGCSHIWANSMSSGMNGLKLKWNDAPCTVTSFFPGDLTGERRALNQLIIEFNQ